MKEELTHYYQHHLEKAYSLKLIAKNYESRTKLIQIRRIL
jgi:hypothetical protein